MNLEEKNKTTGGIENDDTQDNEFLKELELLGKEDSANEELNKTLTEEEKQREFNRKKEEERKAKELAEKEEKARKEQEELELKRKQEEELAKQKEAEEKAKQEKQDDNRQNATKDVRAFREKYPDVDVNELAKDKDFMRLARREWGPDGSTLIEVYEYYTDFVSRVSQKAKEDVASAYAKKGTPSLRGSGSSSGGIGDIYSEDDVKRIAKKMPTMTQKEYDAVIDKYLRSVAFYSKK